MNVRLEFVMRILDDRGFKRAEYILRQDNVECINYWPSDGIHDFGNLTLDQFIEGLKKIREEKDETGHKP